MKRIFKIFPFLLILLLVQGCKISYTFSGTSIAADVKTYTVEPIENKALRVNPSLSNTLTEALLDKYKKLTKLEMVTDKGDLVISGQIVSYETRPMAITADEVSAQTRLTVTVKIMFSNRLHPEEDFQDKTFSAYADFDSMQSLDAVEAALCDEIIEILVEDIFNSTVANW